MSAIEKFGKVKMDVSINEMVLPYQKQTLISIAKEYDRMHNELLTTLKNVQEIKSVQPKMHRMDGGFVFPYIGYSPEKALSEIYKALESLRSYYLEYVIGFVEERYMISLQDYREELSSCQPSNKEDEHRCETARVDYLDIFRKIKIVVGDLKFRAERQIIDNFIKSVGFKRVAWDASIEERNSPRKLNAELKGKRIKLAHVVYTTEDWGGELKLKRAELFPLEKALAFFFEQEQGKFFIADDDGYLIPYESVKGNFFIKVKLFKNGRLDLIFSSPFEARRFWDKLEMDREITDVR